MAKKQPVKAENTGSARFTDVRFALFLLLAVLAAYWPALQGSLLWDDDQHVTQPELASWHGLERIWFEPGATAQYYPLLHSAFWLEHLIWGDATLGYHLVNVILHAASAFLVFLLVRRLGLPGARLSAFLFALHPVCVEAVAWISEQKSTLSAVFVLGSALAYLRYLQTRRMQTYWIALAAFVLALLSKTTAATLPAALLVLAWWTSGKSTDARRDLLPLVPWFLIAIPAGLVTAWVERRYIGAQGVEFALTFTQRLLLAGRALFFYAGKVILPFPLTFSYPRWQLDPSAWWQWLFPAGVLAVAIALAVLARKQRGPLAAFLIFAGTLFPALGFFNVYPFRYSFVADHFQYLALLALLIPISALLTAAFARISSARFRAAAPVALAVLLGSLTFAQSADYSDSETLYRATLARNPDSFLAHNNLGLILVTMPDRINEGIAEYRGALRVQPNYPEAHFNLGAALAALHDPSLLDQAVGEYETALRLKPDYAEAYSNLGNALSHVPGRLDDAVAHFQDALRLRPGMLQARIGLGNAYAHMPGRLADAEAQYRAVLRIDPSSAEAHFNLGNVLLQTPGGESAALAEYQTVLRLRPDADAAREMIERLSGSR